MLKSFNSLCSQLFADLARADSVASLCDVQAFSDLAPLCAINQTVVISEVYATQWAQKMLVAVVSI